MSEILEFDDGVSRMIEASYTIPGFVRRRAEILGLLSPRTGESILDLGCGPGFLSADLAAAVGPNGQVAALDASESMLGLARRRCEDQPWVKVGKADVCEIPYPDVSFDRAACVQVYEYVRDIEAALREMHRVLKPGGRFVVVDTDWRSLVWNNSDQERMARVLAAWDEHLVHPALPGVLHSLLGATGFRVAQDEVYVLHDPVFDPNTFGAFAIGAISMFVAGRDRVTGEEATAWAEDLMALGREGRYFFSLNQYMVVAEKV